ncbi:hypothetical protein [Novosphingobium sp. THN1]|uniref:hypothetical protein n=1 Tax=Novosphingobium sp. THN1 TaxID=1016987 RepID=UPI0013C343BC|nr:hypothetical protein [Novosphingobium sp. THN1]
MAGGIPARERAFLRSLSPEDLEVVARRLNAVWRAEQGEQPLEWLAQFAGVSRARFYVLRKAWAKGDLPALLRQQTRKPSAKVEKSPLIEASIQYLRDNGPNERNRAIARTLIADGVLGEPKGEPSVTQIQKLDRYIRVARRLMQTDADFLIKHYGHGLLIDLVGTDIILDLEVPQPAVIALVIETASGVIFSAGIGAAADENLIQASVIEQALQFVTYHQFDRRLPDPKLPDLFCAVSVDTDLSRVGEVLGHFANQVLITPTGGYARGLQAAQLLGPKMGPFALTPRRLHNIASSDGNESLHKNLMSIERASAMLNDAVSVQNKKQLKMLNNIEQRESIGLLREGNMYLLLKALYYQIYYQYQSVRDRIEERFKLIGSFIFDEQHEELQ